MEQTWTQVDEAEGNAIWDAFYLRFDLRLAQSCGLSRRP